MAVGTSALLAFVLLPIFGAPVGSAASTQADQLIEKGVDLRAQGKDAEALALFQQAHKLQPTPRAMAQVALAEQALGRWVDAEAHLEEALKAKEDRWIFKHKQPLEQALAKVRDRLGSIEVIGNLPGAEVRINGHAVGALPLQKAVRVVAGNVLIEVTAPDHWPLSRSVPVEPGARVRESVELVAKTPAVATAPTPPVATQQTPSEPGSAPRAAPPSRSPAATVATKAEGPRRSILPWLAGGGAVAGLGVGIVAGIVRNGNMSDYNDDSVCLIGGRTRDENCKDKLDAANSAGTIATVGFIAAGAFALGSAALFLFGGGGSSATAQTSGAGAVLLGFDVGPGLMGLSYGGTF